MPTGLGSGMYSWLVLWYCGTKQDKRYESCSVVRTKTAKNPRPEIKRTIANFAQKTYALPATTEIIVDNVKRFNPNIGTVCATVTIGE